MRIGIIGNYGATNVGDDAILMALVKLLAAHSLTVFSADPKKTASELGVRSAPLFPLGFRSLFRLGFYDSLKALRQVDVVILGGGGLFQDSHLYACFLWAWQVFWVTLFGKPLFIYACGVGPIKTRLGRALTHWAHGKAVIITVRDEKSKETLVMCDIPSERIHVTADPAFLHDGGGHQTPKNVWLISLRPWLKFNPTIITAFTTFLQKVKEERQIELVFVSMQQIRERDHQIIDPIMKKTGGRLYVPQHFSELIEQMRGAECAIGMRYHFLIAALITGTPTLPISYSPKVDELFLGTPLESYLIPVADLSGDALVERCGKLMSDTHVAGQQAKIRAVSLKTLAEENQTHFDEFTKRFDQKGSQ